MEDYVSSGIFSESVRRGNGIEMETQTSDYNLNLSGVHLLTAVIDATPVEDVDSSESRCHGVYTQATLFPETGRFLESSATQTVLSWSSLELDAGFSTPGLSLSDSSHRTLERGDKMPRDPI